MAYTTDVTNSNIRFLNGLQSALNALITNGGATKGAFYLTSDTHRLYIGQDNGAGKIIPVPVNQGVTTVASVKDLNAEAGAFYYVADSNVLAVYNGTQWVQINPDTYVKDFEVTTAKSGSDVTVTSTITDNNDNTYGSTSKGKISFTGANGINVDVDANKKITITGDTYRLSNSVTSNKATIKLDSTNTTNDSSVIVEGGDNVTIAANGSNIKISAKDTTVKSVAGGNGNGKSGADASNNGFYIEVTDSSDNAPRGSIDPVITLGTNTSTSYHFVSGTANLPVYTKKEVDKIFKDLDAMTYKGTIGVAGSKTEIPTSNIKIGDTYLFVSTPGEGWTIPGNTNAATISTKGKKGDMIIARGTEGSDGFITSATLTWDLVPAGDDTIDLITYTGVAIDNGIQIDNNQDETIASFTVNGAAGGPITVTDSKAANGKSNSLTISHNTVTKSDSALAKETQLKVNKITVNTVAEVVRDAYGHVTGVKTKAYEIVDTVAHVSEVKTDATASTTGGVSTAVITNKVTTADANDATKSATGTLNIQSSTLQITATAASGSTAAKVVMDMVWGKF